MSKKIVSRGTAILRNTIKLYDVPNIPHQPVYHDMHAPYKSRIINVFKILMQEKELKLLTINSDKKVTPETIIPVEKINGPILLISSKHDEVWPSYESASLIEEKLSEASFGFAYKHIAYENMSHAAITEVPWVIKLVFKSERKHPKECAADRTQMKKELLTWINDIW